MHGCVCMDVCVCVCAWMCVFKLVDVFTRYAFNFALCFDIVQVSVVSSRDFGPDFGALCNLEFSRDSCEIVCGTVAGKIAVVTI